MAPLDRCETGIAELDQILRGGIPTGSSVLLAGGSGMGKTTLAIEFLSNGAKNGERGAFLSATEPLHILDRNFRQYAFLEPAYLDDEDILLRDLHSAMRKLDVGTEHGYALDDPVKIIVALVQENDIKRLVLDSLTAICQRLKDPDRIRDFIFRLGLSLSELECTTILTSETPPRKLQYSPFGIEEFIADGIVFLSEIERHNDLVRTLQVMKMRGTEHSRAKFMMDLSEFGISLAPLLKKFGSETRGS